MDDSAREFVGTFQKFMQDVINQAAVGQSTRTPLGEKLEAFLGTDAALLQIWPSPSWGPTSENRRSG
jgi:hypothetical protein